MGNNVKLRSSLLVTLMLSLAACGGGSSNGSATPGTISTAGISVASEPASATSPSVSALSRQSTLVRQGATQATAAVATPLTRAEAAQFLGQASFGPTMASIDALVASSKADWINNQFQLAPTLHRNHIIQVAATGVAVGQNQVLESFWNQAINGNDQLRQRVTYALSQIFVISMVDANIGNRAYGVSSYYDMLNQNAFGNFRDLLQGVALHPMMGIYLSHMRNQKESGARVPDENFAREVMQLMSIGLYQLNLDGSIKTSGGKQLETYTHDDVMGLAKVFTGWSWAGPDQSLVRFHGGSPDPARDWTITDCP